MSSPQDENRERLRRIREAADNPSPAETPDALTQKLLQEIGQLSQQVKGAKARAEQLEKVAIQQGEALKRLASAQQHAHARIHQLTKAQKAQPASLSEADVVGLISDKLSVFKAKLLTFSLIAVMAITCYSAWQGYRQSNAPAEAQVPSESQKGMSANEP